MRLVILESPFAGEVEKNIRYAKQAVRDCLARGEAPIASHLLFTQDGILRDGVVAERATGIAAGVAWYSRCDAGVFYLDRGMSTGMAAALAHVQAKGIAHELRFMGTIDQTHQEIGDLYFGWEPAPICLAVHDQIAEMPIGRLQARRSGRAPTEAAPFEVSFSGQIIAYYPSMAAAKLGAELFYRWAAERAPASTTALAERG